MIGNQIRQNVPPNFEADWVSCYKVPLTNAPLHLHCSVCFVCSQAHVRKFVTQMTVERMIESSVLYFIGHRHCMTKAVADSSSSLIHHSFFLSKYPCFQLDIYVVQTLASSSDDVRENTTMKPFVYCLLISFVSCLVAARTNAKEKRKKINKGKYTEMLVNQ